MTREEIIKSVADKYVEDNSFFIEDDNVFDEISDAFEYGAKLAYKTMIDKMRKLLEDIDFEMEYTYSCDGYTLFDEEKFIDDILNVMEE